MEGDTPRLEHIGIAVRDAREVERLYRSLFGYASYKSESVSQEGVRTIFLSAGSAKLELLESLDAESPVRRFLERRGEGLHHLAFEVDDAAREMERLRGLGFEPLGDAPRRGADGKVIFFLHPRQTHGVLVEFCQRVTSPFAAIAPVGLPGVPPHRTAGPAEAPPLLLLSDPDEDPAHGAFTLADVLMERFVVVAPETETTTAKPDEVALLRLLDHHEIHRGTVVTLGTEARRLTGMTRLVQERLSGLAVCFPGRAPDPEVELPNLPLVVASGGRRLDAALAWHRSAPGSAFVALPVLGLSDVDAPSLRWLADQIFRCTR